MEMKPTVIAGYHDQAADILSGVNFRKGLLEGSSSVALNDTTASTWQQLHSFDC